LLWGSVRGPTVLGLAAPLLLSHRGNLNGGIGQSWEALPTIASPLDANRRNQPRRCILAADRPLATQLLPKNRDAI
jgi:hypothetical protein